MNQQLKDELIKAGVKPDINGLLLLILSNNINDSILKNIDEDVLKKLKAKGHGRMADLLENAKAVRFSETVGEREIYKPSEEFDYSMDEFINDLTMK